MDGLEQNKNKKVLLSAMPLQIAKKLRYVWDYAQRSRKQRMSMLSVVIPALNAEKTLISCFTPLVTGAAEGLVKEVILVDGGSRDETCAIAEAAGCEVVQAPRGRGTQLGVGARCARADWLLFLHADTVLGEGWHNDVAAFIRDEEMREGGPRAAAFRFRLHDEGFMAWLMQRAVALRCALFGLPYGDQGLLIHCSLYREVGGFDDIPLMEDVAIVRRIGRRRMAFLPTEAKTSAERYRRDGYIRRVLRNFICLMLYFCRVPPRVIVRLYG